MKNGQATPKQTESEPAGLSLVFPGAEQWELWQGASWDSLKRGPSAEQPAGLPGLQGAVFCFPSSAFFSLPLWTPLAEGVSSREQAALNLEGRGLLGTDPATAVWAVETVRREAPGREGDAEGRELQAAVVLQPQLPADWVVEGVQRHEISGRLVAPAGLAAAVLRRELNRWVLDLYENGRWLHSQILMAREPGEALAQEIHLLLLQMEQEGISRGCKELEIRATVSPAMAEVFQRVANLRLVARPENPPFSLPRPAWDLLPAEEAERRNSRAHRNKVRRWVTLVLAADLAVWILAGLCLLVPALQGWWLERKLAPLRPEYQKILQAQTTWEQLRSLTQPSASALEVLHRVSEPLLGSPPKMAVKLTAFNFSPAELVIEGLTEEGEQVITDYLRSLSQHPQLANLYVWPAKPEVSGQGQTSVFRIVAPSTAPQAEKQPMGAP